MIIKSLPLYQITVFVAMYIILVVLRTISVNIYTYWNYSMFYWDNDFLYDAIKANLAFCIPVFLLQWLIFNFGSEAQKREKEQKAQKEKDKREKELFKKILK